MEKKVWERVRAILGRNGRTAGAAVRNRYGALLKGILHCSCCKCSMIHTYTVKEGSKRYRYYVCLAAQKKGWDSCPTKSIPAGEIERFVVEQIMGVGRDPAVLEGTLRQMRQQIAKALADAKTRQKVLERELARCDAALRKAVGSGTPDTNRLAELNEQAAPPGRSSRQWPTRSSGWDESRWTGRTWRRHCPASRGCGSNSRRGNKRVLRRYP